MQQQGVEQTHYRSPALFFNRVACCKEADPASSARINLDFSHYQHMTGSSRLAWLESDSG